MGRRTRLLVVTVGSIFTLSLLASVPGQSASSAPAQKSAKQGEFLIKATGSMRADQPGMLALKELGKNMEARTNGRVTVQLYPDNQLGSEREVVEGLTLNSIQMAAPANAVLTAWVPDMNIFELPFIWRDHKHLVTVVNGPIGQKFAPALKAKGLRLLGYSWRGSRHIMTTKKPINSVVDLKGLKIRTMENPVHMSAFRAFGANPVPIPAAEIYTSLGQGVVDGGEAANTNYYASKFYEPAPNWAMVNWLELVAPLLVSEKFWQSLPKDIQTILAEEGRKATIFETELYVKSEEESLEGIKKKGVKITTPDRKPFTEASRKVYDEWGPKVGGRARIDEIMNAR